VTDGLIVAPVMHPEPGQAGLQARMGVLLLQGIAAAAARVLVGLDDRTGGADSYVNLHICSPAWARGVKPCA